jgi:hypothetical protein
MDIKPADVAKAMYGSLEHFVAEVIDSIEFDKGRKLTSGKLTSEEVNAVDRSVTNFVEKQGENVEIIQG